MTVQRATHAPASPPVGRPSVWTPVEQDSAVYKSVMNSEPFSHFFFLSQTNNIVFFLFVGLAYNFYNASLGHLNVGKKNCLNAVKQLAAIVTFFGHSGAVFSTRYRAKPVAQGSQTDP